MKLDCKILRDLRVLRGRQALKRVTEIESPSEEQPPSAPSGGSGFPRGRQAGKLFS